jgi:hypothetical protein
MNAVNCNQRARFIYIEYLPLKKFQLGPFFLIRIIPHRLGIHLGSLALIGLFYWIPAYAGMTGEVLMVGV